MSDTLLDGTVIQDGLRFTPRSPYPADTARRIPYPVIGQITRVVAAESPDNFDQETYLCDIHVTELGIDLMQVPWTLDKAGPDNYIHYGPVAATRNLDFSPFNKSVLDPKVSNGDTVIVCFAFADVHRPYILRVLPHNQSGPNGMSPDPRPKADDGDCYKVRYNGTNFFIDKDGNITIENTDTLDLTVPRQKKFLINWNNAIGDANTFTIDMAPGAEVIALDHKMGSYVHLDPDGSVAISAPNGENILVSPSQGIQLSTTIAGGTSVSMKSGLLDILSAQGLTMRSDFQTVDISAFGKISIKSDTGDVYIEAPNGETITVSPTQGIQLATTVAGGTSISMLSGFLDLFSARQMSVTVDSQAFLLTALAGEVSLKGSGGAAIRLRGGKVALGNEAGDELLDLVFQAFTALSTTTAAGFGAPISSVANFATLAGKIMAIKDTLV